MLHSNVWLLRLKLSSIETILNFSKFSVLQHFSFFFDFCVVSPKMRSSAMPVLKFTIRKI